MQATNGSVVAHLPVARRQLICWGQDCIDVAKEVCLQMCHTVLHLQSARWCRVTAAYRHRPGAVQQHCRHVASTEHGHRWAQNT